MVKSAAQAKTTDPLNVHRFVGEKMRELRGAMRPSDFASKNGIHQAWLAKCEAGEPTCKTRLSSLAEKNGIQVGYFFPDGKIPDDYPEH